MATPTSRDRIEAFPVAQLQLQFTLATALAVTALLVFGGTGLSQRIAIAEGITLIAVAGLLAFAVSRSPSAQTTLLLVPALDMVGLAVIMREAPYGGLETLLVFPLIWLATSYPGRVLLAGCLLAVVLVWLVRLPGVSVEPVTVRSLLQALSASCALALAATMTWWMRRRSDAQHVLLQRQTAILEGAFDRSSAGEETVRQVLDAVAFAVLAFDGAGRLVTANRASVQLVRALGLPPTTDLMTLPFYRADGFEPVAPEQSPVARAIQGDDVDDEHYWLGHPGEARAALSVSTRILRDRGGATTSVVLVASDVTGEFEATQARDDLAASISHELRTPLSSIIGYVDLALDEPGLSEQVQAHLEVVAKNADRMLILVNDLLAHREREASGSLTVSKVPMDLVPVVRDSVSAVLPMARDRLIAITVDMPNELRVLGDALRLRQVIDNLLSNAIKYNREGGQVEVLGTQRHDEVKGDLVEIAVSDTGRGMTPEETRRLFERFYRAPSVRHTAIRGSGLGLNISRQLVDLHRGTIRVASVPNVGTTMTVTLPALEVAAA
ncbi:sensor histidine kinase [Nocardioides sp. Kera G14]|uniref:sensor histidine kinase n=1 Tax=Nocardioides sp. Kera G14 TaxID=2884264 RepID=UPI001D11BE96|nr:PAS domain-containing sensor histidine kinase [Nocardioides sp. Kera G14]UDY25160.1 PAS domain-containing sensor histidine kinase [Nocardioides sp. Kera G14]